VGPITARTLIAELPELGTPDGKRIASLVAYRHNPVLKAFRQRLVDAGKPKMLVAIAAARKLLTLLNAILRDKQPWRPENA
jgi:transposase